MNFKEKLHQATRRHSSLVCVGLDTDVAKLPYGVRDKQDPILYFNQKIIDATADLVCCYKPNFAFYGALGASGFATLQRTIEHVPDHVPVLVDAKVGDIGNTADQYAKKFFSALDADALTVTPYMGYDAVAPFTSYKNKTTFLVCLTSNPGADDFEKQQMGDRPLYEHVIAKAHEWNAANNIGLVIGATQPEHFARVRELAPELPLLIPGIGAQGGDVATAVKNGQDKNGAGIIVNSSRGIIFASQGDDYAEAARAAALALRDAINAQRSRW